MILLLVLLAIPLRVTYTPKAPTIGDPIHVRFDIAHGEHVKPEGGPEYEIVSVARDSIVVRTFDSRPFRIRGLIDGPGGPRRFELDMAPRSVLDPKAPLTPAPLKPPHEEPLSSLPWIAIGGAALAAAAAWLAVWLLSRRADPVATVPLLPPDLELRDALDRIATRDDGWAELADLTRRYLARVGPSFGLDLTTSQVMIAAKGAAMPDDWRDVVAGILRRGDLQKFAPGGRPEGDFQEWLRRAHTITSPFETSADDTKAVA